MKTLDEIALACGTDKSSRKHNYTKLYAAYFEQLRDKPISLFEIGAANGHSLKMWKEYFPKAKILSIDIQDSTELNDDRIKVEIGSQSDVAFLKRINEKYGPFDIIIDDGSHINSDMKVSFDFLFPLLKPGGLYVIEDIHACYWEDLQGTKQRVFMDRLKELVDSVNSNGKSGTANHALDHVDTHMMNSKTKLTWWEDVIEFIHLYRSIAFIKKYPATKETTTYIVDVPKLFFRANRKIKFIWQKIAVVKWAK